jgi:hypothetical protein
MYILLSDDLDFLSHSEISGSPFDVRIQCILTSLIPYMFHPFPLREYRRIGLPVPVRHRPRIATGAPLIIIATHTQKQKYTNTPYGDKAGDGSAS